MGAKGGAKEYGINISEVARRALEKEVRRRNLEEAMAAARRIGELLSKIPEEEMVKWLREVVDKVELRTGAGSVEAGALFITVPRRAM